MCVKFFSPSGCTFWGKKPWSRKKKILWQMGTLIGAPLGIALAAGVVLPAMVIGIPVYVGRQVGIFLQRKFCCFIMSVIRAQNLVDFCEDLYKLKVSSQIQPLWNGSMSWCTLLYHFTLSREKCYHSFSLPYNLPTHSLDSLSGIVLLCTLLYHSLLACLPKS